MDDPMDTVVYFSNGVCWRMPRGTNRNALIDGIKSAIESKEVFVYKAVWDQNDTQTLLFNGAALDFVAVGDLQVEKGHPARG